MSNFFDPSKYVDPLRNPSSPPYIAPVGKRWQWTNDYYGGTGDKWVLENLPSVRGEHNRSSRPAWDGLEVDYQAFWRKPRSWWKRALWLPWKKY